MSPSTYSPEFKDHVVGEVVDKHRTIKAVAESYDLVAHTLGVRATEYRTEHPDPGTGNPTGEESREVERLRKELHEARMEVEVLTTAAAFFAGQSQ